MDIRDVPLILIVYLIKEFVMGLMIAKMDKMKDFVKILFVVECSSVKTRHFAYHK